jgi:hypothetical protein
MFVRFRQTKHRLQLSLVETRRIDGRVLHEHIASLGSIENPPTVRARTAFWQRLHERLAKLSNRIDPATQGRIRARPSGRPRGRDGARRPSARIFRKTLCLHRDRARSARHGSVRGRASQIPPVSKRPASLSRLSILLAGRWHDKGREEMPTDPPTRFSSPARVSERAPWRAAIGRLRLG